MNTRIREIIFSVLEEMNSLNDKAFNISDEMTFIGSKTELDSLDFVKFILELESAINEEFNLDLSLLNDKAFSPGNSPYYNITTLTEYIFSLREEQK